MGISANPSVRMEAVTSPMPQPATNSPGPSCQNRDAPGTTAHHGAARASDALSARRSRRGSPLGMEWLRLAVPRCAIAACRRRKAATSRSAFRGAPSISSPIASCRAPLRQASNTTGLIYDLRHTAGVFRRSVATRFTVSTMRAAKARSLLRSGSGVEFFAGSSQISSVSGNHFTGNSNADVLIAAGAPVSNVTISGNTGPETIDHGDRAIMLTNVTVAHNIGIGLSLQGSPPLVLRNVLLATSSGGNCAAALSGTAPDRCPGSLLAPAELPAVASWLPLLAGLTEHGQRHAHQTMLDDLISRPRGGVAQRRAIGVVSIYCHSKARFRQA